MERRSTDRDELEEIIERGLGEMVRRDLPGLPGLVLARLSAESDRRPFHMAPVFARLAIVGLVLLTTLGAWLVLRPRPLETTPEPSATRQSIDGAKDAPAPVETENIAKSTAAGELSAERAAPIATPESGNRVQTRVLTRESRVETTPADRPAGTSLHTSAAEIFAARDLADDPDAPIAVKPLAIPELPSTDTHIEVVDIAPLVIAPIQLSPLDVELPR